MEIVSRVSKRMAHAHTRASLTIMVLSALEDVAVPSVTIDMCDIRYIRVLPFAYVCVYVCTCEKFDVIKDTIASTTVSSHFYVLLNLAIGSP
jgi:hypothetical protein